MRSTYFQFYKVEIDCFPVGRRQKQRRRDTYLVGAYSYYNKYQILHSIMHNTLVILMVLISRYLVST